MRPTRILLALATLLLSGCGHVIYDAPNHSHGRFDFRRPPCVPMKRLCPAGEVGVRYLGSGGVAIEWGGAVVLVGPYFSNYGLGRVLLGRLSPDLDAIRAGLSGVQGEQVAAILVGHSHHDHLGDVPAVAGIAPRARIFVNGPARTSSRPGSWENVWCPWSAGSEPGTASRGRPSASSPSAPGTRPSPCATTSGPGPVKKPLTRRPRVWSFKAGSPMAFVIDLLSPDLQRVRFRIYYQDAANPEGLGAPPEIARADGHGFDLAILCAASHNWERKAPEWILEQVRPRHVLVSHYDDFFSQSQRARRFVPLLTDTLANRYLDRIDVAFDSLGLPARGPAGEVCGPSSRRWTMPVVGERVRFAPTDSR